jgi:hypothetical protein
MDTVERTGRVVACLSFVLFAVACALPALEVRYVPRHGLPPVYVVSERGIILLIDGLLGPLYGVWIGLANLTLALAWMALLYRRWWLALVLAVLSVLTAGDLVRLSRGSVELPSPLRGGTQAYLERPLIGCYVWLGSMVVAGGGALYCWYLTRRRHT